MAILHIKRFPDAVYRKLQARARRRHRSLSQEVIHLLSEASAVRARPSLLELGGLGAEMWRKLGGDAAGYVRREREAWD